MSGAAKDCPLCEHDDHEGACCLQCDCRLRTGNNPRRSSKLREEIRIHYTWMLTHYGPSLQSKADREEYLAALKAEPAGELSLQELKDLVHLLETERD